MKYPAGKSSATIRIIWGDTFISAYFAISFSPFVKRIEGMIILKRRFNKMLSSYFFIIKNVIEKLNRENTALPKLFFNSK